MINPAIMMLTDLDGVPVCNVAFDLSAQQVGAAHRATGAVRTERHRPQDMTVDDVLAMRELTGVVDELDRLQEAGGHATVTLPFARLVVLHDALGEWATGRTERGWMREAEQEDHPVVEGMLQGLADLRADAVCATLDAERDAATR